jgi:branched-chain amino acid transport system ATP-binding protein
VSQLPIISASPSEVGDTTGAAPAALEVESLAVRYGRVNALSELSFSAARGELVLILGTNGAGKSSAVNAIAGLTTPFAGRVRVDGRDVTRQPAYRRVRSGVSLVPEGRGTLPGLSVRDNLELGFRARARDKSRGESYADAVERVIALFPILGERLAQDCGTLSGGEMQMLAIGRALLARPTVLLLDEPSLGLAPRPVAEVYEALDALAQGGLTIVIIEQKSVPLKTAPALTVVLHNGCVIDERRHARPTDTELAELYMGRVA